MLIGSYQHTIDAKGRMFMPARYRDELGDTFIVTKGLDRCLVVYSVDEFMLLKQKVDALPITNKNAREFTRFYFSGAAECTPDKQGRISIPQKLREYANLDKDVTVTGASTHAEIWNSAEWEKLESSLDEIDPDEMAEKMADFGL